MKSYLHCPNGHMTETNTQTCHCGWVAGEHEDDLDAFVKGIDQALELQYGPDHQIILSQGKVVAAFDWTQPIEDTGPTGLELKLADDPSYRPHCLNCNTMRRLTLFECQGRRIMTCEKVRDDTYDGTPMRQTRIGCGYTFDIHTGQEIKS